MSQDRFFQMQFLPGLSGEKAVAGLWSVAGSIYMSGIYIQLIA